MLLRRMKIAKGLAREQHKADGDLIAAGGVGELTGDLIALEVSDRHLLLGVDPPLLHAAKMLERLVSVPRASLTMTVRVAR
jgi:hypothetical protein